MKAEPLNQQPGLPGSYQPSNSHRQLASSPQAHACWYALSQGPGLRLLVQATESGLPAMSLVEPLLVSLIDPSWFESKEQLAKKMVGEMVFQILERHGFHLVATDQPMPGYIFSHSAVYEGSVRSFP
ncbi:MAG: hypothetical protein RRB13_08375 [bacterium]|nr:hypothetical protein [bacterium]